MKKLMAVFTGTVLLILNCLAQPSPLSRKITVDYKQQSLQTILTDLGATQGFEFSYANDNLPLTKKLSIKAVAEPAQQVFERLFTPLQISFVPVGKKIVLKANNKKVSTTTTINEVEKSVHQTVRGVVLNKETRQPLAGATVVLQGSATPKYAITDEEGAFRFSNVPVGRQDLQITMTGYQSATLSGLLVNSAKEAVINVEMTESANLLETVTVKHRKDRQRPSNEIAVASARSFTVEETSRYAASIFDPAHMALSFAGVAASDDLSNELVIRGNSPKGVLWRLEGVEINNPNHFTDEGSSGGGVSMISSSMLDNSDFYTGAFPAEYGNALSGVFDLKFRKGNTEKREHAFMIGLLGTEASIEGPFKKGGKASYLVNYRYSTLALLKKLGMNPVNNGAVPEYQDLAFNLNFPTKGAGTFSFFGIGGTSRQVTEADKDAAKWETFWDRMNTDFRYRSASTGLTHEIHTGSNSYIRSVLSYS
ncbi:MAG: carboxypeptidase regulatory-like domain-containing protein, partial [Chitinophagaceae bacterium]